MSSLKEAEVAQPALAAFVLPEDPDDLIVHLESALGRETSKVSEAVSLAIDSRVRAALGKAFQKNPENFDKALMRRLSNALMGTGEIGETRTLEALSLIPELEGRDQKCEQLARTLRTEVAEFRKAKSYLAHQAKCINAFLKFFNKVTTTLSDADRKLLAHKITTAEDFRQWSKAVSELWAKKGGLTSSKNNRMYQSYWEIFTDLALDERSDAYSLKLINDLFQTYLPEENFEAVMGNLSRASLANRNQITFAKKFTSSLKLEKGLVTITSPLTQKVENNEHIREDLVFLLAQNIHLEKLNMEVKLIETPNAELTISFAPPKEMSSNRLAIDAVNQALREILSP